MYTRTFKWTKRRRNYSTLLRGGKTVEELKATICAGMRTAGKVGGWRESEIAMGIADRFRDVDEVAARLRERGKIPQ